MALCTSSESIKTTIMDWRRHMKGTINTNKGKFFPISASKLIHIADIQTCLTYYTHAICSDNDYVQKVCVQPF